MSTENKTPATPAPKYFYTTNYPHRWGSGPILHNVHPKTYADIASLEEAKQIAEELAVESYSDDRCVTTYGIQYSV